MKRAILIIFTALISLSLFGCTTEKEGVLIFDYPNKSTIGNTTIIDNDQIKVVTTSLARNPHPDDYWYHYAIEGEITNKTKESLHVYGCFFNFPELATRVISEDTNSVMGAIYSEESTYTKCNVNGETGNAIAIWYDKSVENNTLENSDKIAESMMGEGQIVRPGQTLPVMCYLSLLNYSETQNENILDIELPVITMNDSTLDSLFDTYESVASIQAVYGLNDDSKAKIQTAIDSWNTTWANGVREYSAPIEIKKQIFGFLAN